VFPDSLKHIKFGRDFNNGHHPLVAGVLPKNLETIDFGENFNNGGNRGNRGNPLDKDVFPQSIKEIDLGLNFSNGGKNLVLNVLPSLISLKVNNRELIKNL
jgi:hypothetical protein